MDWIKLVIPLIAVAIWIVNNLARQQREARLPPRLPTAPPPRPRDPFDSLAPDANAKPEEDNKYREEMDRQRQKRPAAAKSLPRPRPRRNEPKTRPQPRPVVTVPFTLPGLAQRPEANAGPTLAPAVPVLAPSAIKVGQPAVSAAKSSSAAIKDLLDILKKRDSLVTVFLLKEVLDLPLSKRPRRRK